MFTAVLMRSFCVKTVNLDATVRQKRNRVSSVWNMSKLRRDCTAIRLVSHQSSLS